MTGQSTTAAAATTTPPPPAAAEAARKAEQERKAAAKAEAKQELEALKTKIKGLEAQPQTDAVKRELETLKAQLPDLRHAAEESQMVAGIEGLWEKFKSMLAGKDGKGINWGSLLGGGLGLLGAYLVGGIFGDGMLGTVLKVALAIPFAIFGSNMLGGIFGGDGAEAEEGRGRDGRGQVRTLQLSLEGLEQVRAAALGRGVSSTHFMMKEVEGKVILAAHPAGGALAPTAVSYDVLRAAIVRAGKDRQSEVAIDLAAALRETKTQYTAHSNAVMSAATVATAAGVTPRAAIASTGATSLYSAAQMESIFRLAGHNQTDSNLLNVMGEDGKPVIRHMPAANVTPNQPAAAAVFDIQQLRSDMNACGVMNNGAACDVAVTMGADGRASYQVTPPASASRAR